MMRRQLERYGKWLLVIGVLVVCAGASAAYIMYQQRVVTPFADRYVVKAEFANSTGLEPGLGQPVDVAGVRVGSITKADLVDGRSVVSLQIDPGHLPRVYRDAKATLLPNTPLDDMQVELEPGTPSAGVLPDGQAIPEARTASPVNLDEFLASLDADTRTYFQVLLGSSADGLHNRGEDLRALLRTLKPTSQQLQQVSAALAGRRRDLRRAVHELALVTTATAGKDEQLGQVVDRAAKTISAVAGQEQALGASVAKLPGTLRATRQVVGDRKVVADLGTTLNDLLPVAKKLPSALKAAKPLVAQATPLVRDQVRPLVRGTQPMVRALKPTTRALDAVTPSLTASFDVLNYLANELGYSPAGSNQGYLFWLAWYAHNLNSTESIADGNGSVIRGFQMISCDGFKAQPPSAQLLMQLFFPVPICQ
jgi:phospholipid/cholesterol/gamma-HCH transport system substrate-binding protein